jgi:uncharacterized cupin superfamily protein
VRNLYTDDTGRFFGGIWRSGKGAWHVSYTENELCVLTEGRVRISDDHGRFWTFGPGDCFVMPAGFRGVWEVLEPARKFYAIYEPPPAGLSRPIRPLRCDRRSSCAVTVHEPAVFPSVSARNRLA